MNGKLTVDCQPFVLILTFRQLDTLSQAASSQGSFGILPKLVTVDTTFSSARAELISSLLVAAQKYFSISKHGIQHGLERGIFVDG